MVNLPFVFFCLTCAPQKKWSVAVGEEGDGEKQSQLTVAVFGLHATRNPKPATRNLKPETWNLKLGT